MAILPPPYSARKASPPPGRSQERSRNRSISIRGSRSRSETPAPAKKHRFTLASLRGSYQPELSRRLYNLIKCENYVINSYESAGHERQSIATQLSQWGEQTGDEAVNELSDKLGVLLNAIGSQEEVLAQNLEEYRSVLKQIRNTESSVQPSRDNKTRIHDEINKLKYKDPTSTKITILEQELVRAEAENLVAEAQLTNITRAKLKEAFATQFAAIIERAEKQMILAKHGRRMLNLLDDTPVVPGDAPPAFEGDAEARQIIQDAEQDLRSWNLDVDRVITKAHPVAGGVVDGKAAASSIVSAPASELGIHPAHRKVSGGSLGSTYSSGSIKSISPPYPLTAEERAIAGPSREMRREEIAVI